MTSMLHWVVSVTVVASMNQCSPDDDYIAVMTSASQWVVIVIVIDIVNCCSPDDEYVAAGSGDGGVYIWQVATSKLHSVLRDHQSVVFCLSHYSIVSSQMQLAFYRLLIFWSRYSNQSVRVPSNMENLELSEFCKPGKVREKSGNLRYGQGIFMTCHMVRDLLIDELMFACNV